MDEESFIRGGHFLFSGRSNNQFGLDIQEIEHVFSIPRAPPTHMRYLMVDETYMYIGKRLHHRGHQTRKRKFWFMTATEVDEQSGESIQTHWEITLTRTRVVECTML